MLADIKKETKADKLKALNGFSDINRYWDAGFGKYVAKILPGQYYVTHHRELIATVLGSCVSACIRDNVIGIGGMNHFMLPIKKKHGSDAWKDSYVNEATRYGNFAMEHLINDILKNGGRRKNLELKVFGGGKMIQAMTDIGLSNINFIHEYISTEELNCIAEDLGDIYPRKILFDPKTGKVKMKKLRNMHNRTIVERENIYMHELEEKPKEGSIDLF